MKRIFDLVVSILVLFVIWPILLLLAIAIKLDSKGPVLFKQQRVGRQKRPFYILKFRTMGTDTPRDMPTHLLQNPDAYITKIGKLLRKTSLDELPQLWNIVKGEMSIVGPRPALFNQTDLLAERDRYEANAITPGLTGWAQINGRDELPNEVKAKLDGQYVERQSFGFDLKIIWLTVISVLRSDGVREGASEQSTKDGATSPKGLSH